MPACKDLSNFTEREERAGEWNPQGDVIRGLDLRWFSCLYQEAAQPPHLGESASFLNAGPEWGRGGQGCTHIS